MKTELVLRFDYGRLVPWVRRVGGDLCADLDRTPYACEPSVPVHGEGLKTEGEFTIKEGEVASFVLTWHPSNLGPHEPPHAGGALERTLTWWRDWCSRLRYQGAWARRGAAVARRSQGDDVRTDRRHRGARRPLPSPRRSAACATGITATAGCAMPRSRLWALHVGGYTTRRAPVATGCCAPSAGDPAKLQISTASPARAACPSWRSTGCPATRTHDRCGSATRPPRSSSSTSTARCSTRCTWRASSAWAPDDEAWACSGTWSIRGRPLAGAGRGHLGGARPAAPLHALEGHGLGGPGSRRRAIEKFGRDGPLEKWRKVRQQIHDDVIAKGFDAKRNTFIQYYGSKELDASLLMIPLVHFLPRPTRACVARSRRSRGADASTAS